MEQPDMDTEVPRRIQTLRKRCGLSIRRLAELAGVTPAMISCIERGKNSPSLGTLQKILTALGTDFAAFFAQKMEEQPGPIFLREHMQAVSDGQRTYTIVFVRRTGVRIEIFDEYILPSRRRPPFETLKCDLVCYMLSGDLVLEIKNRPKRILRPGDSFYLEHGSVHRGYPAHDEPVRLISVFHPAKY
jgi:HTH-type transcriptional regulator, repressor for puuD